LAKELAQFYPNSIEFMVGIGELLVNAIEHGNLEISHEYKQQLMREFRWHEEIENRLKHPDFSHREVKITLVRSVSEIVLTIVDDGKGFNWQKYIGDKQKTPSLNGRGIAFARASGFDSVEYQGTGNTVVCVKKLTS
jgi:anti-sigma regulatory factor (Ser/Thr protein kinase)